MKKVMIMLALLFVSISSIAGELNVMGYDKTQGIYDWSDIDFSLGLASYWDRYMGDENDNTDYIPSEKSREYEFPGVAAGYLQMSLVKYDNFRINGGYIVPVPHYLNRRSNPYLSISYAWELQEDGWLKTYWKPEIGFYYTISKVGGYGIQLNLFKWHF